MGQRMVSAHETVQWPTPVASSGDSPQPWSRFTCPHCGHSVTGDELSPLPAHHYCRRYDGRYLVMWNRVGPAAAWKVEPNPAATVICIDDGGAAKCVASNGDTA